MLLKTAAFNLKRDFRAIRLPSLSHRTPFTTAAIESAGRNPTSNPHKMLRCKISSNFTDLDVIHQEYPWIPSSSQVRPSPQAIEFKLKSLGEIQESWATTRDYILYRVFKRDFDCVNDRFIVFDDKIDSSHKAFKPNDFPYQTELGCHWVMWYGSQEKPYDDERINADIVKELGDILGRGVRFDFAWYENPKMTVPEFYHVQVFWIKHDC